VTTRNLQFTIVEEHRPNSGHMPSLCENRVPLSFPEKLDIHSAGSEMYSTYFLNVSVK